ncbi:MAG: peptidoglycan DD-metalloendopeptidase family protein [Bacteroidetes bacterium]|nr:peptidoglycan DD-metalloendopeptidase family protein [Bacteroidota bacterium]
MKTKHLSAFILMMSTSLVLSAFSPDNLHTSIKPKTFFAFNALNPDEKPAKDDGKKKAVKRDDTLKTTINPLALVISGDDHEDEEVDSLLAFPSNDLYSSWDTTVIHPYSFAESFKQDSAIVRLTEPTDCGFVLPFNGNVTSEFGWRKRRPHYGTDIDLETGDTVMAAFDGMVRIAKLNRSYGNVVIIRHKNGLETVYAHLSKILVEAGQTVEAGQQIGLGGNTGHSFGSHLHFEMRYLGQAMDAEDFIDFATGTLKKNECMITRADVETKYDLRALHSRQKKDLNLTRVTGSKSKHGKVITVKKGDTLGRIAQRNHTTIKAICKKNGIKQTKVLRLGQKLKV